MILKRRYLYKKALVSWDKMRAQKKGQYSENSISLIDSIFLLKVW